MCFAKLAWKFEGRRSSFHTIKLFLWPGNASYPDPASNTGYPKRTKGGLFYNPKDKTIKVSTHATFFEESYMDNFKPRSKVVLKELSGMAMGTKVDSIKSNTMWKLVDLPIGIKPIGCNWIYKKRNAKRKVETHKAKLVGKGYTQKEIIDYYETFSLVAMLKLIRILLSITATLDFKIWQMDVKTTLLNDYLGQKGDLPRFFSMKDLGEASYILRIRILRDQKNKTVALSQASNIDKTMEERDHMSKVPYALEVGSLMYAMLCTRPDICFAIEMDLTLVGYTDLDFQTCKRLRKSTLENVFVLGCGAIVWRSAKQTYIADSTMEVEYVAASEATKEAIWIRKFLTELEVIPSMEKAITLYCDNNVAIANTEEMRSHKRTEHINRKCHLIREAVAEGIIDVMKVDFENNLANLFTKTLVTKSFNKHVEDMGMQNMTNLLHWGKWEIVGKCAHIVVNM
ncbi:gag/pol protein [Gossypium australe]|uniref:Gag/pol protein n=1 Tax=Gossypium australe TaxID=47621 RepID=A0A5B6WAV2_9ROSI|nr:gag/pol protein [Gossypium australe]